MSTRVRSVIAFTTIIALTGVFSVRRVVADSAGASVTRADGSSTQISALARYVATGEQHTCVVLDDASLKCFGANTVGQIGSGGIVALGDAAAEMGDALVAVRLGTGRTVRAVSAGALHTCALLDDASVKCFGEGGAGRLGSGAETDLGRSSATMGDSLARVDLGSGRTAVALAVNNNARTANVERLGALRRRLVDGITSAVPCATETLPGSVAGVAHICFEGLESESILFLLDEQGVCVSAASACASGAMEPSHVLAAMGVPRTRMMGSVRFSLGHSTTDGDIDRAIRVTVDAARRLAATA